MMNTLQAGSVILGLHDLPNFIQGIGTLVVKKWCSSLPKFQIFPEPLLWSGVRELESVMFSVHAVKYSGWTVIGL